MQRPLKTGPWTEAEIRRLIELKGRSLPRAAIAAKMRRSPEAVYEKWRSMRRCNPDPAWHGLGGEARLRAVIEGELADRADALLADKILERMAAKRGVSPDVIFDTMVETLSVLFPDRYGEPAVKPVKPAGRLSDPDRGGLTALVRKVRGG